MKINSIEFENFRNLEKVKLLPSKGVNIIYGDNAQGKTNILEGIWLLSGQRSFRNGKESEMVMLGLDTANKKSFIRCTFDTEDREQEIYYNLSPKKEILLNGITVPTQNALVGTLQCAVFSPVHLSLVKDGPSFRRDFVDSAICQLKPIYSKVLADYSRVLSQRGNLLRDIFKNPALAETLDIWDSHLIRLGKIIVSTRASYINHLAEYAQNYHTKIAGDDEKLAVTYSSTCVDDMQKDIGDQFAEKLIKARREDIKTGTNTVGPHRDDAEILINGISARNFASQGQQRSAVLALKLAECEMIFQTTKIQPIVLLDDVMSELDTGRREFLLSGMEGRQIFITGCDKAVLTEGHLEKSFFVNAGKIVRGATQKNAHRQGKKKPGVKKKKGG